MTRPAAGRELDEERLLTGSFAVVDSAVLEARRKVRDAGYDPLRLPDISQASSGVQVSGTRTGGRAAADMKRTCLSNWTN